MTNQPSTNEQYRIFWSFLYHNTDIPVGQLSTATLQQLKDTYRAIREGRLTTTNCQVVKKG